MTDFKSAAEQQVRETLGWWIEDYLLVHRDGSKTTPYSSEKNAYNALVSKTAELLEMTAQRDGANKATTDLLNLHDDALIRAETAEKQRDEAQKALEQADKNWQSVFGTQDGQAVIVAKTLENDALLKRAESAEATIREQAERIKELEETLALTQSLSSQIWDAAEVAWKEGKTEIGDESRKA